MPTNQPGARRVDDRRTISGIIHVIRAGCRWQDCPRDSGPATTVCNRFNRWSRRGFWRGMLAALPKAGASTRSAVIAERDRYETAFTAFVDGLAFAPELDRRDLRLAILGAVNRARTWYRSGGETPATIAAQRLAPFRGNLVGDAGR